MTPVTRTPWIEAHVCQPVWVVACGHLKIPTLAAAFQPCLQIGHKHGSHKIIPTSPHDRSCLSVWHHSFCISVWHKLSSRQAWDRSNQALGVIDHGPWLLRGLLKVKFWSFCKAGRLLRGKRSKIDSSLISSTENKHWVKKIEKVFTKTMRTKADTKTAEKRKLGVIF